VNADARRERLRRVEALYHAAAGLSAAERAAYLADACGSDVQLRHEVEALLSVAPDAERFLEPGLEVVEQPPRIMTGWLVGHHVGPYVVKAVLAAGGMGEVYRATDTRLGRDVAMKVLPLAFSADAERVGRFEQEARAAAGLNHPNILAVFDVGTHEGASYLVSELLDGETLRDILDRGPLPVRAAIDYAIQIAHGLAAAHDKGIVHRDVKPENVFVTTDGRVKILDFGVAKLSEGSLLPAESAPATRLASTTPGALIGTIGYMSPEQVRGQPVDRRSDIFGFGAVLYELVAGRRAFERQTSADTLSAILHDEPPPAASDTPAAARALQVAHRCLEKSPHARFQSARDLALVLSDDLADADAGTRVAARRRRIVIGAVLSVICAALIVWLAGRVAAPSGSTRIRSIAVLPLENLSRGPDDDYVAAGVTEALITDLAKIRALRVVSRTSVLRYTRTEKPLRQIGKELDVDAVVEGSIERVGNRVRISAKLIRASTDEHLWAQSYDRDVRDVLMLQEEVARSIVKEVRVTLTPDEAARLAAHAREVDPDAYQLYVRGRYFWDRRTEDSVKRSIDYFNRAIQKDPAYAAAYSGLADCYLSLGFSFDVGSLPPNEAIPKAKAAALKALALDDSLAEAHNSLAYAKLNYDWDWSGAEDSFRRSLELNPGYAQAHHWYSHLLLATGRVDDSLAEARRALDLDQLSPIMNVHLGWNYLFARQYDLALSQLAKTIEFDPNYGLAYWYRGLVYEQQARYDDALRDLRKGAELLKGNVVVAADIGHLHAVSGNRREADRVIAELRQMSTRRFISSFEIALIHAGLGHADSAFDALEQAYRERSDLLVYLNVDPRLDPIRSDRRFDDLVRRVGIPR